MNKKKCWKWCFNFHPRFPSLSFGNYCFISTSTTTTLYKKFHLKKKKKIWSQSFWEVPENWNNFAYNSPNCICWSRTLIFSLKIYLRIIYSIQYENVFTNFNKPFIKNLLKVYYIYFFFFTVKPRLSGSDL